MLFEVKLKIVFIYNLEQSQKHFSVIFKLQEEKIFQKFYSLNYYTFTKEGPFIIYAIHRNQFIDALILEITNERMIHQIIAAKIIGQLAKLSGGIPVERTQDLAFIGEGQITSLLNETILKGENTQFKKQINLTNGSKIILKQSNIELEIISVINDTELIVKNNLDQTSNEKKYFYEKYSIINKVNQADLFKQCYQVFKQGQGIGIFPEGGSRYFYPFFYQILDDQPDFLPMKPGIAILGIVGSLEVGKKIKLIPCGIHYYEGAKFRGKVVVQYGLPFEPEDTILEKYQENKKEAISQFLQIIKKRVKEITITAPTYKEMMAILLFKKIYKADNKLTAEQESELNRKILLSFEKFKDNQKIKELLNKTQRYQKRLNKIGMKDYELVSGKRTKIQSLNIWTNLFQVFFDLLFLGLVNLIVVQIKQAFPGLIIAQPLERYARYYSEKQRLIAVEHSTVKNKATDVVASYKILCYIQLFPIYNFLLSLILLFILKSGFQFQNSFFYSAIFFSSFPIYIFFILPATDSLVRIVRLLKSKLRLIWHFDSYCSLRALRKNLEVYIRLIVNEYGQMIFENFEEERIIKQFQFKKTSSDEDNSDGSKLQSLNTSGYICGEYEDINKSLKEVLRATQISLKQEKKENLRLQRQNEILRKKVKQLAQNTNQSLTELLLEDIDEEQQQALSENLSNSQTSEFSLTENQD